ncbi:polysaccharide pyruvyl transferase family protein, partial [Shewanella insulae]|uniref:polysaccharide pyruvyl transferase family protein n=1 Tax=Shewanella insulae TaxID=2681496 RepID=UPI001EFCFE2B
IFPNVSPKLTGDSELAQYFKENRFSHIIVGSDQVWRYKYGKEFFPNFFINFDIPPETKKVAFSASFGTSKWECDAVREEVSGYLTKFDAISLREHDGVELCSNYFGVTSPKHTCDPTLLNDISLYLEVCQDVVVNKRKLSTYVLDSRASVNILISDISSALDVCREDIHQFGHRRSRKLRDDNLAEWLSVFRDSDFIITDSFHGMIFSIIFRKPFYVIVNNARGASRFESLLSLLGLTDRMIDPDIPIKIEDFNTEVDYADIIDNLEKFIGFSKDFLHASLTLRS